MNIMHAIHSTFNVIVGNKRLGRISACPMQIGIEMQTELTTSHCRSSLLQNNRSDKLPTTHKIRISTLRLAVCGLLGVTSRWI